MGLCIATVWGNQEVLPAEQALLTELKRRSSWNRFTRLRNKEEGLFLSQEGRIIYRALATIHQNGNGNGTGTIEKKDLARISASLAGEKQGEVRREIDLLGEPLKEEASWEIIWRIVSTQHIVQSQNRLLQAARTGGTLDPDEARDIIAGWTELSEAAHTTDRRRLPVLVREAKRQPSQQGGDRFPSGLHSDLDQALGGGLRRGELGCLVAPSGHGKTTSLLRVAGGLAQRGHRVVYLSFEIYIEQIVERLDTLLRKKLPKTLYVQDYPSHELTVEEITRIIHSLEPIDCLIVDHVELLNLEGMDEIHAVGRSVQKLRNWARKANSVVWTASQGSEPELGATFLERKDLYGSRKKLHAADLAIGLLFAPQRNLLKMKIWKTRHTQMGLTFAVQADMVNLTFRDTQMFQQ